MAATIDDLLRKLEGNLQNVKTLIEKANDIYSIEPKTVEIPYKDEEGNTVNYTLDSMGKILQQKNEVTFEVYPKNNYPPGVNITEDLTTTQFDSLQTALQYASYFSRVVIILKKDANENFGTWDISTNIELCGTYVSIISDTNFSPTENNSFDDYGNSVGRIRFLLTNDNLASFVLFNSSVSFLRCALYIGAQEDDANPITLKDGHYNSLINWQSEGYTNILFYQTHIFIDNEYAYTANDNKFYGLYLFHVERDFPRLAFVNTIIDTLKDTHSANPNVPETYNYYPIVSNAFLPYSPPCIIHHQYLKVKKEGSSSYYSDWDAVVAGLGESTEGGILHKVSDVYTNCLAYQTVSQ